jgi:hypothetical protein
MHVMRRISLFVRHALVVVQNTQLFTTCEVRPSTAVHRSLLTPIFEVGTKYSTDAAVGERVSDIIYKKMEGWHQ